MKDFPIEHYGAKGDGVTKNTAAIQQAIDEAAAAGGGRVIISGGTYLTGALTLRSFVELHIESDATLLGSPLTEDYPEHTEAKHVDLPMLPRWRSSCLIFAEECRHIAITGQGTIDCNGTHFVKKRENALWGWSYERLALPTPPRAVFLTGCSHVLVEGITMTNQPSGWSYWIHDCDYVRLTGLNIEADLNFPNNDGIHINSSRHVTVSDCNITCGDDCIILRANNASLKENKVLEQVTVTNCNLTTYCCGVRLGWANDGTIRNCTLSNLTLCDCNVGVGIHLPNYTRKTAPDLRSSGGSDVGREATLIENITFSNIIMDRQVGCPISVHIHDGDNILVDAIRNLYFTGIHARGPEFPSVVGRPGSIVENLYFNDCSFEKTDGSELEGRPHQTTRNMYEKNDVPIVFRHVKNVHMNNTSFTAL